MIFINFASRTNREMCVGGEGGRVLFTSAALPAAIFFAERSQFVEKSKSLKRQA